MNIVKKLEQYDGNNLFFCEPIKNNVMSEGNFIRILYSNHHVVLNGIYLFIPFDDVMCEKYYSKYKCSFSVTNHKETIERIKSIEENILKKYKTNKNPSFKIYDNLKEGNIKIFSNTEMKQMSSFILKISGVWETQNNYGLTYKFMKINSSYN